MMVSFTQDNGIQKLKQKKATGCKFGLTVLNLKDFGKMIWQMGTGDSFWRTEMFSKEIGSMIRRTEMEIIIMLKVQLTKGAGMKINKKEEGEKNGRIVPIMKENITEAKNTEVEYFNGRTGPSIMANGKTIKCTGRASLNGLMGESIRANTKMIKNMAKAFILGRMEECIKDNFKMGSNMEKGHIVNQMDKKYMECGKKAKK
jgi:hypothetical protein